MLRAALACHLALIGPPSNRAEETMSKEPLSKIVEKQEWLNSSEETVQNAVKEALQVTGDGTKDFLHGKWIGHPLHVILTDIPLGSWTAAVACDAIASITDNEELDAAADATVAVGLVGALGAALTGITDWSEVDPPARRIGFVHALLNIGATGLFTASLVSRRRGSRASGRGLAALGFLVATVSAKLGGSLVYEHRIGVDRSTEHPSPSDFVSVMAEADLPQDTPKRAMWEETPILLVRRGSQVYALQETCSHLGGPLSEGKLDGDTIQCPWHGSTFSIVDGSVVRGPAVHPQSCLDVRVRNGQIEVRRHRYEHQQLQPAA
jgi:nitrite reductase/ring-hydroxylating ferredoxin subunit/uncharacterized membrane protein